MLSVSYREESYTSSVSASDVENCLLISEGVHAKYHYLICGVQGDFTRGLVNDPPTHIWTRQLKVSNSLVPIRSSTDYQCHPVRRCFQYVHALQTRHSGLYRYRSRRSAINLSSGKFPLDFVVAVNMFSPISPQSPDW